MQLRLTERTIEKLVCPKGRLEVGDALLPGLVLRVTEQGSRTWALLYRVAGAQNGRLKGKLRRLTLGRHPLHSLEAAREKARAALREAERGIDPHNARRAMLSDAQSRSFDAISERFIELYAKPNVETWPNIARLIRQLAVPVWSGRQIDAISRSAVHDLLDDVIKTRGIGRARELRKHLSKLFNWSVDRGFLAASPVAGMRRPELAYVARERVLSMAELKRVWDASKELGYPFGSHVCLLLLTLQRRNEIAQAQYPWLLDDLEALEIPASHYKTERPHVVPLSDLAQELIRGLPRWETGEFLLSTAAGTKAISGFSKAKRELNELAGLSDWTLHDLRRSGATHMARLGVAQEHIERVLGHTIEGIAGTYNRYSYLDEKRSALSRWGGLWN